MQDGKMDGFRKNLTLFLQDLSIVSIQMQKTMLLIQIRPFNFVKWSKFFKSDENAGWNKSAGRNNMLINFKKISLQHLVFIPKFFLIWF